jgi:sarcosine oxidase
MGSAVLDHLARAGQTVLGLEQFSLGHSRGSSHGKSRIIREAYYEHPDYVPLVRRSFTLWKELQKRTKQDLLTSVPCLSLGTKSSTLIQGVRRSAQQHGITIDELTSAEIMEQYPAMKLGKSLIGLREKNAGVLNVEQCVLAHLESARATKKATIKDQDKVLNWEAWGPRVRVNTTDNSYTADKLIITTGAWSRTILGELKLPLTVMRQVQFWYDAKTPDLAKKSKLPIYVMETPEGEFYGVPNLDGSGHKIAQHYGAPELSGPGQVNWAVQPEDETAITAFLKKQMPGLLGERRAAKVCMYTLTPDRHFLIDHHPEYPQVLFATGFSGHGFKFASVVGEILADLAIKGKTKHVIEQFRLARFTATAPSA